MQAGSLRNKDLGGLSETHHDKVRGKYREKPPISKILGTSGEAIRLLARQRHSGQPFEAVGGPEAVS